MTYESDAQDAWDKMHQRGEQVDTWIEQNKPEILRKLIKSPSDTSDAISDMSGELADIVVKYRADPESVGKLALEIIDQYLDDLAEYLAKEKVQSVDFGGK